MGRARARNHHEEVRRSMHKSQSSQYSWNRLILGTMAYRKYWHCSLSESMERDSRFLHCTKYLQSESLLLTLVKVPYQDSVKVYEEIYKGNKKETPFRIFLKDMFKYSDHVEHITIRNHSLNLLAQDQMDFRKHITMDTVASIDYEIIDFMKISNFRGILNFDMNFKEIQDDTHEHRELIEMFNTRFLFNGYQKMGNFEYKKFMQFMKVNPMYNSNQYIVI